MKLLLQQIRLPLREFSLEIDLSIEGQIIGLYGASGSGKTSLLDLIAGLRRPSSGSIQLNETILTDPHRFIPPQLRHIGYVSQDDTLFPHLSVKNNLLYGAHQNTQELVRIADILELNPLMNRKISGLSGGEKQRVALARSLLTRPRLLLLDEPLASLDEDLKGKSLTLLKNVCLELGVPMIYVSHSAEEIFTLAQSVIVLKRGRVVQHSTVEVKRPAQANDTASCELDVQLVPTPIPSTIVWPEQSTQGARVEFRGIVRDTENNHSITALRYEAYPEMALKVMRQILTNLNANHPCTHIKVIHRIGIIPTGETAIYVGAISKHRAEAFQLVEKFMNQLKQDVPIWKVESIE